MTACVTCGSADDPKYGFRMMEPVDQFGERFVKVSRFDEKGGANFFHRRRRLQ